MVGRYFIAFRVQIIVGCFRVVSARHWWFYRSTRLTFWEGVWEFGCRCLCQTPRRAWQWENCGTTNGAALAEIEHWKRRRDGLEECCTRGTCEHLRFLGTVEQRTPKVYKGVATSFCGELRSPSMLFIGLISAFVLWSCWSGSFQHRRWRISDFVKINWVHFLERGHENGPISCDGGFFLFL